MNVTIKGIRLMDFPPSPTGAYQLAKIDFSIEGVMTMTNAMLGWAPHKGARIWLQPAMKDRSNKTTVLMATHLNDAILVAAKRAFEAIGGVYPNGGEVTPYEPRQPELSAAVALVRQVEARGA